MTETRHPTIEAIAEDNPEAVTLDGLDDAILGIISIHGNLPVLMYSVQGIINILRQRDGMTEEDAWDHFGFNIGCLYAGEYTPVLVDDLVITPESLEQINAQRH